MKKPRTFKVIYYGDEVEAELIEHKHLKPGAAFRINGEMVPADELDKILHEIK